MNKFIQIHFFNLSTFSLLTKYKWVFFTTDQTQIRKTKFFSVIQIFHLFFIFYSLTYFNIVLHKVSSLTTSYCIRAFSSMVVKFLAFRCGLDTDEMAFAFSTFFFFFLDARLVLFMNSTKCVNSNFFHIKKIILLQCF